VIPYNGNPYSTIRGISADQTQSFDGDGQAIKKVVTETTHDNTYGDETTTATTYLVRSSVLGGKVVTEINSETGQRGFVYLGNEVLAWQIKSGSTELVKWEHRDLQNASFRMTFSNGSIDTSQRAELDPLNANAGTADPTTVPSLKKLSLYPGWGDAAMSGDTECNVNGMFDSCDVALRITAAGAGRVVSIFGTVPNYTAVRVEDPATYDPDKTDPTNPRPNAIVTIHEHYHYELVYTGVVKTSFQQRQPQNPTMIPLGDLRGNMEKLLTGDCFEYTTRLLAEAARLFAGDSPHLKTIMEGYQKITAPGQGGFVFKKEGYDTVSGNLFANGALPGTVQLLQNGQFHPPSAEETAFYQAMYTYKAVHEIFHLASRNGYDDEQMATAAYSLAKRSMNPVPANKTGS
jgi:hypothetical protein